MHLAGKHGKCMQNEGEKNWENSSRLHQTTLYAFSTSLFSLQPLIQRKMCETANASYTV